MKRYHIFRVWRGNPQHTVYVDTVWAQTAQAAEHASRQHEDDDHYVEAMGDAAAKAQMTISEQETAGII